jgi:hypothetical protein
LWRAVARLKGQVVTDQQLEWPEKPPVGLNG